MSLEEGQQQQQANSAPLTTTSKVCVVWSLGLGVVFIILGMAAAFGSADPGLSDTGVVISIIGAALLTLSLATLCRLHIGPATTTTRWCSSFAQCSSCPVDYVLVTIFTFSVLGALISGIFYSMPTNSITSNGGAHLSPSDWLIVLTLSSVILILTVFFIVLRCFWLGYNNDQDEVSTISINRQQPAAATKLFAAPTVEAHLGQPELVDGAAAACLKNNSANSEQDTATETSALALSSLHAPADRPHHLVVDVNTDP